jgi:hypothetical protein
MKKIQILVALMIISVLSFSQTKQGEVVVTKTQDIKTVLSSKTQYLLDEFTDGIVYYETGSTSRGKLNYNLLLDEMHFISPNKEVLAISNPATINFISIGNRVFMYNPNHGYTEVVYNGDIKLLVTRKVEVKAKPVEHRGAYGETSSSAAVATTKRVGGITNVQFGDANTIVEGEVLYKENFLLQDKSKKIYYINSLKAFERVAGKKNRDAIRGYIKSENINLELVEDLFKLTKYLNTLTN